MKSLSKYLFEQINNICNESIIPDNVLGRLNPKDLRNGILSMYEYISNNNDIKMFYMDFNSTERPLWKKLYELYITDLWNIVESNSSASSLNIEEGKLLLANSEIKRKLRLANNKLDVSQAEYALIMDDNLNNNSYIIVINRSIGLMKRFMQKPNYELLVKIFNKLSKN